MNINPAAHHYSIIPIFKGSIFIVIYRNLIDLSNKIIRLYLMDRYREKKISEASKEASGISYCIGNEEQTR